MVAVGLKNSARAVEHRFAQLGITLESKAFHGKSVLCPTNRQKKRVFYDAFKRKWQNFSVQI
jgi:hypothetical protein